MRRIVGIQNIASPDVFTGGAKRNLVHIGFGKNQCTCRAQSLHSLRLLHPEIGKRSPRACP